MFNITIATVNWNCAKLIEKLLYNLREKASHPDKIKAVVVDNTNGADISIERLKNASTACNIHTSDTMGLSGSRAHANALNLIMEKLDTEFTLVIDPDVYVFKKGWDDFCISQLNNSDHVAIGAPYPSWKVGKYHNFPSPFFCFFRTQTIRELRSSWEPFSKNFFGLLGKFMARQVGRLGPLVTRKTYTRYEPIRCYSAFTEKILGVFAPDTGWRIAEKAKKQGLQSILFKAMLPQNVNSTPDAKGRALIDLASQYELFFYDDEPVLTHKYGSSNWPWKTKFGHDENFWRECIKEIEENC